MIAKKKLYITLSACSVILSIIALSLNIKTVPLIKKQHAITKNIQMLKEHNQQLQYHIEKESTLKKIEEKAKNLNMVYLPTKPIKHIIISSN